MKTHAGFEVIEDAGDYQTLRCPKCDHTFRADAYGLNVLYDLKHTLIPQCESCGFTEAVLIKDEEAEAAIGEDQGIQKTLEAMKMGEGAAQLGAAAAALGGGMGASGGPLALPAPDGAQGAPVAAPAPVAANG